MNRQLRQWNYYTEHVFWWWYCFSCLELCARCKTSERMHTHCAPLFVFVFFLILQFLPSYSELAAVVTRLFRSEWLYSRGAVFLRTYQTNKFSWARILICAWVASAIANWKLLASGNSEKTANNVNFKAVTTCNGSIFLRGSRYGAR